MIIPAYMTAKDVAGTPMLKENVKRVFHSELPHADRPEACFAWPGTDAGARVCGTVLHRMFKFNNAPWYVATIELWNATVPEFKAERAYIGCVDARSIVAEWSCFQTSNVSGPVSAIMDWFDIKAMAMAGSDAAREFIDVMLPDFAAAIDAEIAKHEGAAR